MAIRNTDTENIPTQPERVTVTMDQMERLIQAMSQMRGTADPNVNAAVELFKEVKEDLRRANPIVNTECLNLSVFNVKPGCTYCDQGIRHEDGQYGHPKPQLKYECYQCSAPMRADALTIREVELLNQFDGPRDARDGKWTARFEANGKRLMINYPATDIITVLGEIPALEIILMELLLGPKAVDPVNLVEEVTRLKNEIEALKKKAA